MPPLRYEVVYTMARALAPDEWRDALALVQTWLDQRRAFAPARFEGATCKLDAEALLIQFADSEDLRVERAGTISIWSARSRSMASHRLLAGVLLCLQRATSAAVFQLSGDREGWAPAAEALATAWGDSYRVVEVRPSRVKADPLLCVDAGGNRALLRSYFRAALDLDATALPDSAFSETLLA